MNRSVVISAGVIVAVAIGIVAAMSSRHPKTVVNTKVVPINDCVISGCNREICSDHQEVSDCVYKPEFACYRDATCIRLGGGACGWVDAPKLHTCLIRARQSANSNTVIK